jgi:hypothetical protein
VVRLLVQDVGDKDPRTSPGAYVQYSCRVQNGERRYQGIFETGSPNARRPGEDEEHEHEEQPLGRGKPIGASPSGRPGARPRR